MNTTSAVKTEVKCDETKGTENTEGEFINISIKNIPSWLHESELYKDILINEADDLDKEIPIKNEYFKTTSDVNNSNELLLILQVINFWSLNCVPESVFDFVLNNHDNIDLEYIQSASKVPNVDNIWDKLKILMYPNKHQIINNVAEKGYMDLLKFLDKNGHINQSDYASIETAGVYGHLDYLKYAIENMWSFSENLRSTLCNKLAYAGSFDCILYLFENGFEMNLHYDVYDSDVFEYDIYNLAAKSGNLKFIELFNESISEIYDDEHILQQWNFAIHNTVQHGHLDCLIYLHELGCELDSTLYISAAKQKNLDILQYLYENECPLDVSLNKRVYTVALYNGNLDYIKFLHEIGYPLDESVFDFNINEYYKLNVDQEQVLECMKYLHNNGCPLNKGACYKAVEIGHLNC